MTLTNANLRAVAAASGVSVSTASRALSGASGVNEQTRETVRKLSEQMGYRPNKAARSLAMGRTSTIGLIVPDIANPFFPIIIKAVQARANQRGYSVVLADTDEQADEELVRARSLRKQVDGLIMLSPRTRAERLPELVALGPVVIVNREVEGTSCVLMESADGFDQAVEYLHALGHRRIGYLNGPKRSWSNERRRQFIASSCETRGLELVQLGPFEPQIEAGMRAADLVIAADLKAVIAYDDMIALGVSSRLAAVGVDGESIHLIGVNDSPYLGVIHPNLSSIRVSGEQAGSTAMQLLLNEIAGDEDRQTVVLETRLVVRTSTSRVDVGMPG